MPILIIEPVPVRIEPARVGGEKRGRERATKVKGGERGRESALGARSLIITVVVERREKKEVSSPGKERGRGGRRRREGSSPLSSLVYKMKKNGVRVGHA